jgi:hypothetical protein
MNRDENIAEGYLKSLDLGPAVHEPDGNQMPDFLVDGRIAVEVRRLNQHVEIDDGTEGLESVEAALGRFIDRLLPTLGPANEEGSWWVSYHFRRPLDLKALKRDIPRALRDFTGKRADKAYRFELQPNFGMDLQSTSDTHPHKFLLGAYNDYDAGGFVGAEIIRNANLCIAEKAAKLSSVRERYPEWWLLLVDRIGPNLNASERNDLPNHISPAPWDRVVLLDPAAPSRALTITR